MSSFAGTWTASPRDEVTRAGRSDGKGGVKYDGAGALNTADLLEAFFHADAPVVDNSRDLAKRMAGKARLLRNGVVSIFESEGSAGPLNDLLEAYRGVLIGDLNFLEFADLQASDGGVRAVRGAVPPR